MSLTGDKSFGRHLFHVCWNEAVFTEPPTAVTQIRFLLQLEDPVDLLSLSLFLFSVENGDLVCSVFVSLLFLFPFVFSHRCLALSVSCFFLYIVTYLCCFVWWCLSPLRVRGRCRLCKLTVSFHSTQTFSAQVPCPAPSFSSVFLLPRADPHILFFNHKFILKVVVDMQWFFNLAAKLRLIWTMIFKQINK